MPEGGGQPEATPEPWEAAELRLSARAERRARAEARRARRARAAPWLALLLAPVLLAAAFVWAVERAGGDLGGWATGEAAALTGACLLLPAALTAWLARRAGWRWWEVALASLAAAALTVAWAVGAGFAVLGYGPD